MRTKKLNLQLTAISMAIAVMAMPLPAVSADYYLVIPMKGKTAPPSPIEISLASAPLPQGQLGQAYSYDLKQHLMVTGDPELDLSQSSWLATSELPAGLTLSTSGVVSGTPTVRNLAGTSFGVDATYKTKQAQQTFSIAVVGDVNIASYSGYRAWADGSYAKSCKEYRSPPAGYAYAGSTGDGVYRVQPAGQSPLDVYCDMTTDGGGWMLLGNQALNTPFSLTTADIGASTSSLSQSWRFGNSKVQAMQATTAYRLQSSNPGTAVKINAIYFSPACVIDYSNKWTGSTNNMPMACQNPYSNPSLATPMAHNNPINSSVGIGTNNSGAYCSMRIGNGNASGSINSGAYDCTIKQDTNIQLWGK